MYLNLKEQWLDIKNRENGGDKEDRKKLEYETFTDKRARNQIIIHKFIPLIINLWNFILELMGGGGFDGNRNVRVDANDEEAENIAMFRKKDQQMVIFVNLNKFPKLLFF